MLRCNKHHGPNIIAAKTRIDCEIESCWTIRHAQGSYTSFDPYWYVWLRIKLLMANFFSPTLEHTGKPIDCCLPRRAP